MKKLDKIDIKILNMLIEDARKPYMEIAEACKLSRAAIHQRIQRLIASDIIGGSCTNINFKTLGFSTFTYIGIGLERGSLYDSVVTELEKIPEVVECNYTTGHYNMLIKLYAKNNDHLMHILNGKIQGINGVVSTETLISLKQSINRPFLLQESMLED
ncbi:Lrp/AsnC ligand binding domain-containing protein [Porphyromonas levii]|uniref:AsnC family transcriptional regulator n=1 Tax=Porphyromonas levii TaxID=28114 RepID=A0A4Y8WRD5_9PORP|nr:Lrp/AsnC ligand binding domain-containing protein [Porphyromonas levii]MBR8703850.1 Regulatory protein AsnC [Porphyromonas levii]MBR8713769.1 Regulatory protein AsnC [Porphyromonas levii]MBR8715782.1 Regulatory protein AsnC [Porphyromonas levii]MBR8728330.1 Regulatory protein AsnC [Porphyromonas levii]MBR8729379.1 Regulatory protein AsnC [Porphyromonas levii]